MHHPEPKSIKGIRIRTVNFTMIMISCILYIFLILATIHVLEQYKSVYTSMENYIACDESDRLLLEGSAYLTEQVRLYTVTAEAKYMEHYFTEVHETRRRELAMEQLEHYYKNEKPYEYLVEALEYSNNLMSQEIYAMRLISEAEGYDRNNLPEEVKEVVLAEEDRALSSQELKERAKEIVFGDQYENTKEQISLNIANSIESIHEITHERMLRSAGTLESTMNRQRIFISILFVENVITFLMIMLLIIKPLRIYVDCIKQEKQMEITGSYEFKYLALTYNDIYELNAANEAMLRHQAEYDPLTGIMNRGAFENLKKVLEAKPIPLAFLIVDVDKFKQVNDGYGHEIGDQVLKKVAKILKESFRTTDYPARIGGDEFAAILTNITEDMQSVIKRKITEMNEALLHPEDGLPPVSLSIGVAFSESGYAEELYKKADLALYQVKENGRCGCAFYQEENM